MSERDDEGKVMKRKMNEELITVPCAECGEPVRPEEVYPVEIEHFDGTTETVLFHKDVSKMCPLFWVLRRFENSAKKLRRINVEMQQVIDNLKARKSLDRFEGIGG